MDSAHNSKAQPTAVPLVPAIWEAQALRRGVAFEDLRALGALGALGGLLPRRCIFPGTGIQLGHGGKNHDQGTKKGWKTMDLQRAE